MAGSIAVLLDRGLACGKTVGLIRLGGLWQRLFQVVAGGSAHLVTRGLGILALELASYDVRGCVVVLHISLFLPTIAANTRDSHSRGDAS